jgi:hypothetical protein
MPINQKPRPILLSVINKLMSVRVDVSTCLYACNIGRIYGSGAYIDPEDILMQRTRAPVVTGL